jgi:hypothetical protein
MADGPSAYPLGQWAAAFAEMPQALRRVARRALREHGELVMAEAKKRVPVDLGVLRASGMVSAVEEEGTTLRITLSFGGAASAYAIYVHEGTGPAVGHGAYMPPPDVIEAWAVRHGFPAGSGFIIARAIGRKGTKARKYLEGPATEMAPQLQTRLEEAARREFGGSG